MKFRKKAQFLPLGFAEISKKMIWFIGQHSEESSQWLVDGQSWHTKEFLNLKMGEKMLTRPTFLNIKMLYSIEDKHSRIVFYLERTLFKIKWTN